MLVPFLAFMQFVIFVFIVVCVAGNQTQGLAHANQKSSVTLYSNHSRKIGGRRVISSLTVQSIFKCLENQLCSHGVEGSHVESSQNDQACKSQSQKVEAGGAGVEGQSWLKGCLVIDLVQRGVGKKGRGDLKEQKPGCHYVSSFKFDLVFHYSMSEFYFRVFVRDIGRLPSLPFQKGVVSLFLFSCRSWY